MTNDKPETPAQPSIPLPAAEASDKGAGPSAELPSPTGPLPEDMPPRVKPRIIAAPKIRQIYWCDFWPDAHLPEMWKTRPVVVVSYRNQLHGPCLVVACSTDEQDKNPWAYRMKTSIDGRQSWVVCNHVYTVAPSRFSQSKSVIPLVSKEEFNEILARLTKWLPVPFDLEK